MASFGIGIGAGGWVDVVKVSAVLSTMTWGLLYDDGSVGVGGSLCSTLRAVLRRCCEGMLLLLRSRLSARVSRTMYAKLLAADSCELADPPELPELPGVLAGGVWEGESLSSSWSGGDECASCL